MLTKADLKTASGLYARIADLRTARDAGESYYGKITLVADNTTGTPHPIEIDKAVGVEILNKMIAENSDALTALGFDPDD